MARKPPLYVYCRSRLGFDGRLHPCGRVIERDVRAPAARAPPAPPAYELVPYKRREIAPELHRISADLDPPAAQHLHQPNKDLLNDVILLALAAMLCGELADRRGVELKEPRPTGFVANAGPVRCETDKQ